MRFCCQRKQSARHVDASHVDSDKTKNTTPHSLDTRSLRRCGEQHCRSPCRCRYASGVSASMVATVPIAWELGRGGFRHKSSENRQRARKPSKPDGRAQQTFQGQTLHRTSSVRHWGRSQQPSPNQPLRGMQSSVGKHVLNGMIRRGWQCEDCVWNVAAKRIP